MKSLGSVQRISVPMQAILFSFDPEGVGLLRCLDCQSDLDLCQPDIDAPGRLLGTCHGCCKKCRSWHIISAKEGSWALMVLLPSHEILNEAIVRAEANGVAHEEPGKAI